MYCLQILLLCLFVVAISHKESVALSCSQCNWRFMGFQNLCIEPRNATGCIACVKSVAKVKLRDSGYIDGWERMSVVTSRLCLLPGSINILPEGCYKQQNNGGYTERCFCYTDSCNSGASRPHMGFISPTTTNIYIIALVVSLLMPTFARLKLSTGVLED